MNIPKGFKVLRGRVTVIARVTAILFSEPCQLFFYLDWLCAGSESDEELIGRGDAIPGVEAQAIFQPRCRNGCQGDEFFKSKIGDSGGGFQHTRYGNLDGIIVNDPPP